LIGFVRSLLGQRMQVIECRAEDAFTRIRPRGFVSAKQKQACLPLS
jgi:hypothetical protein